MGDELLEVAVVPPRDLELLGPAEVELDVVLEREADATEDLLRHGGDVAERLAREQLGHRREPCRSARPSSRAHAASHTSVSAPSTAVTASDEVVRDRLERAERLVELVAVLGVLRW